MSPGALLSTILFAQIAFGQIVPTSSVIPPRKCGNAFQLKMYITERIDDHHYMATQDIGQGTTQIAAIETTKTKFANQGRVSIFLEYLETKKIKGKDGFVHPVDFWRECEFKLPKASSPHEIDEAMRKQKLGI